MEDDLLKRKVVDGGYEFWYIYLPTSLVLRFKTQWFSKKLCSSEADFLLEEHEREHHGPLQDVPSVHVTQEGAGEV